MMILPTDSDSRSAMKTALLKARVSDQIRSSHISEALAAAFGFKSHAALIAAEKPVGPPIPPRIFEREAFMGWLAEQDEVFGKFAAPFDDARFDKRLTELSGATADQMFEAPTLKLVAEAAGVIDARYAGSVSLDQTTIREVDELLAFMTKEHIWRSFIPDYAGEDDHHVCANHRAWLAPLSSGDLDPEEFTRKEMLHLPHPDVGDLLYDAFFDGRLKTHPHTLLINLLEILYPEPDVTWPVRIELHSELGLFVKHHGDDQKEILYQKEGQPEAVKLAERAAKMSEMGDYDVFVGDIEAGEAPPKGWLAPDLSLSRPN